MAASCDLTDEQLDLELTEHGFGDSTDASREDKIQLLQFIQLSESSAAIEEEKRNPQNSQIDPEITDDEESLSNKSIEQFRNKLECRGVSLNLAIKDDDCVVIKEVPNTPQLISREAANITASGIPRSLTKNSNNSDLKSPRPDGTEQLSSTRRCLQLQYNDATRRGQDLPSRLMLPKKKIVLDHMLSNVHDIDVLNCAKVETVPFECEKRRKIIDDVPFHVRPPGMDFKEFLVYFKKRVDDLRRRYFKQQRKCLNFKPWGPPIQAPTTDGDMDNHMDMDKDNISSPDTAAVPHVVQERYNLRGRNLPKRTDNELFDDDDEDIIRPKLSRFTAFESSISHSPLSISDNQAMESTRGRDMIRNADAKMSSSSNDNLDIIDDCQSSGSDFQPAGKEISEPKRALSAPRSKRLCKKREKPSTANKKTALRVPTKAGSWTNAKSGPKEEIEDDDLSPFTSKRMKLMDQNKSVFSQSLEKVTDRNDDQQLEDIPETYSTGDQSVECPICEKCFHQAVIEEHASQCCESPLPDISDSQEYDVDERMISCPTCSKSYPEGVGITAHIMECGMGRQ